MVHPNERKVVEFEALVSKYKPYSCYNSLHYSSRKNFFYIEKLYQS